MRIVAGKYRSRVLKSARGLSLRPTSDKLRETLFNILGPQVAGSVFVDAYAGTGAVGMEALSRGAREVVFIEKHPAAVDLIRRNLRTLGIDVGVAHLDVHVEILAMDAVRGLEHLGRRWFAARGRADFVFLDPPYVEAEEYARALDFLDRSSLLAPGGRVIVEHHGKQPLPMDLAQLECVREVEQGETLLSFYRLSLAA